MTRGFDTVRYTQRSISSDATRACQHTQEARGIGRLGVVFALSKTGLSTAIWHYTPNYSALCLFRDQDRDGLERRGGTSERLKLIKARR